MSGPFRIDSDVKLRLTGAASPVNGILTIGAVAAMPTSFGASAGSVNLAVPQRYLTSIPFSTTGSAGITGSGEWILNLHIPAAVAGQTHTYRATLFDPAAPGGVSLTNRLYLSFGP